MNSKSVKYVLAASLASAAFLGTAIASPQSWSGFYIGVNGGYAWGEPTVSYTPNDPAATAGTCGGIGGGTCIPSASLDQNGGLFGVQVGHNWETSPTFVVGLEADIDWASIDGSSSSPFHLGSTANTRADASLELQWLGTLRARAGFAASGNVLLYATGGLAYGEVENRLTVPNVAIVGTGSQSGGGFSYVCSAGGPPCFDGTSSEWLTGWTLGAGAEMAISPQMTIKLEYMYVDLGDTDGTMSALNFGTKPASFTGDFDSVNVSIVRAGVNFRF